MNYVSLKLVTFNNVTFCIRDGLLDYEVSIT